MTYNIHVGVPMGQSIGQHKVQTTDLDNIAEVIKQVNPDIVALQEVDCEYGLSLPDRRRSSLLNESRYIAAASGDYFYIFGSSQDDTGYPTDNAQYVEWGKPDLWRNNGKSHGEVGNALLTRWRVKGEPHNLPLPKDSGQERRSAILAQMERPADGDADESPIYVFATHLQHDSGSTRFKQMKSILDSAGKLPQDGTVFIMGDLNHEDRTDEVENPIRLALAEGYYDLSAPTNGTDAKSDATYPADNPNVRIDFILCNKPLKVLSKQVINSLASDHLAVAVTVTGDF